MSDRTNRVDLRDRLLIVAALALVAVAFVGRTSAQSPPASSGVASIAGRVVDAFDGRPLASVKVHVSTVNNSMLSSLDVTTGQDGRYEVASIPAGQIEISASAMGYVNGSFGQHRPNGDGVFPRLTANERADNVDVRLWKHAKISGTVRDETGRPVAAAQVVARWRVPAVNDGGDRATATTDDTGAYHLELTEGDYVLRVFAMATSMPIPIAAGTATPNATRASSTSLLVVDSEGRNFVTLFGPWPHNVPPAKNATMYVTSYFGGSDRMTTATPVVVKSGDVREGLDFALIARRAVRLTGIVTGPNGRVPGAMVRLLTEIPASGHRPWDRASVLPVAQALCDAEGRFTFMAAPSGTYVLDAYRPSPPMGALTIVATGLPQLQHYSGGSDPEGYAGGQPIAIGEEDIEGVEIGMRPTLGPNAGGARVNGTLTFARPLLFNGEAPAMAFGVVLQGLNGTASSTAVRSPGGRFVIDAVVPGTYEVRIGPGVMGWSIVSVTSHGRELSGAPLTIGADGISDLALVFADRTNKVSGRVIDPSGRVIRDAGLLLIPVNPDARTPVTTPWSRVRYARADAPNYEIDDMPDGEYFVAAIDDGLMDAWPDAAPLSKIATVASRVTVRNGAHVSLDLRFIGTLR